MSTQIKIKDKRSFRPSGLKDTKGDVLIFTIADSVILNGKKLSFSKPNIVSLFMNKSIKEYLEAKTLMKKIASLKKNSIDENTSAIFDYFEYSITSITNMYCAVEMFTNECIPNEYIYRKKNSKGIVEELNKPLIERWSTLGEKLNQIIPEIFNIEPPNQMPFWNNFLLLEKYRNEVIHPKTYKKQVIIDINNPHIERYNEFLNMLCSENIEKIIYSGIDLIKYLVEATPLKDSYPIFSHQIDINMKEVNRFGDELYLIKKTGDDK